MPSVVRFPALAGLVLCAKAALAAGDPTPMDSRFAVDLGTYFMSSDTRIRVDQVIGIGIGTTFDFEDVFGFDDETVFRLEGQWRFTEAQKLRLMYFRSSRRANDTLDTEIDFGDTTFPVNVDITARFDFEIIELAYQYDFLRLEDFQLGGSLGIHYVGLGTRLTATADIGEEHLDGSLDESLSSDLPMPVVGLRGTWRIGGDFYLQAHAQYFQLSLDGYDGRLVDYQANLIWQFSRHFALGAAYNHFDTKVDVDRTNLAGRLEWRYQGPQLFVRALF